MSKKSRHKRRAQTARERTKPPAAVPMGADEPKHDAEAYYCPCSDCVPYRRAMDSCLRRMISQLTPEQREAELAACRTDIETMVMALAHVTQLHEDAKHEAGLA